MKLLLVALISIFTTSEVRSLDWNGIDYLEDGNLPTMEKKDKTFGEDEKTEENQDVDPIMRSYLEMKDRADTADKDDRVQESDNDESLLSSEDGKVYYMMGSMSDFYQLIRLVYLFRYLNANNVPDRYSSAVSDGGYNDDRMEMVLTPLDEMENSVDSDFQNQWDQIKFQPSLDSAEPEESRPEALTLEDSFNTVVDKTKAGLRQFKKQVEKTLTNREFHDIILMGLLGSSFLLVLANVLECIYFSKKNKNIQDRADYYRLKEEPYNPVLPSYEECIKSDHAILAKLHTANPEEGFFVLMEEKKVAPEK